MRDFIRLRSALGLTSCFALLAACGAPTNAPLPDAAGILPVDAAALDLATPSLPATLALTGLYSDFAHRTLATDVFPYTPRVPTWTDGSISLDYLALPDNGRIDTSDMDGWRFPVGTRSWREVSMNGVVVETRYMWKVAEGAHGWLFASYVWSADHSEARLAPPEGAANVLGTGYMIVAREECATCHAHLRDGLIAVSLIQLSRPDGPPGTSPLSRLVAMGRLTRAPDGEFTIPGDALQRRVLGYLHANCGHCHSDRSLLKKTLTMNLDLKSTDTSVAGTAVYRTTLYAPMFHPEPPDITLCVVPGKPEKSQLWTRVGLRDDWAMPNTDTYVVDADGVALLREWILSLPP